MQIQTEAPAKVNLFLDVIRKRDDGYHEIRSVLAPVSLFDIVHIETLESPIIETVIDEDGIRLNGIPWPAPMPSSDDNLATRAARLLKETTAHPGGARLRIKKNIPVAGGLGGGSADAAAALNGLNAAWRTGLSREALMKLGGQLGCDIPAMVHGGVVCMEGRGEKVAPMHVARKNGWRLLLVNPGIGISTADIYSRHKPDLTSSGRVDRFHNIASGLQDGCVEEIAKGLINSLQVTAYRKYPILKMINNELERSGAAGVLLSGSGATIMALARNEEHGLEIESRIRKAISCPIWTCLVAVNPQ